jgi:hypothetical protein
VVLRQTELAEKQVELLTQAFPERKRLAMQWDAISADQFSAAEHRAKTLGLDVISIRFERRPYDFSAAFRKMAEGGAQMLLTLSSPFFGPEPQTIVDLTIQHRLPTMFIFATVHKPWNCPDPTAHCRGGGCGNCPHQDCS